jgi:phosphosulfolactate synthase (CoM biosynthesis protein A)
MSIDISRENEARLIATAQAEGVSVDAYLERLMNEREEVAAIVERASALVTQLSDGETRAKIESGFLQSERGEVVDGETFSAGLLAELDDLEQKRRAG